MPVVEQTEAVGHAVRATYMYSGMADVAALTGDLNYIHAIDKIWENVVSKKLYVTGGIGSCHEGEAFGANYELPNATAYNETCAAIGNVFWNHRLFLLHGDAKYIDVLERTLYNGLISGLSLSGDLFFYPNPLESNGKYTFNQGETTRKPWFDCACCPVNLARLLPSIPGYVYAHKESVLYINLFVEGEGRVDLKNTSVKVSQKTDYPWDGHTHINIDPETEREFEVLVRIPGWVRNEPLPSDLYYILNPQEDQVRLSVNSAAVDMDIEKGFVRIHRKWQMGDTIDLDLPMTVQRVVAHEMVEDNHGKVALQRGPLVYCFEGVDNGERVLGRSLPDEMEFSTEFHSDLLGGICVINGNVPDGSAPITAVPYYAWSHRGIGEMAVWLPRK
jgi:hypothetical protein